jgi:signal transduction histidine kinase
VKLSLERTARITTDFEKEREPTKELAAEHFASQAIAGTGIRSSDARDRTISSLADSEMRTGGPVSTKNQNSATARQGSNIGQRNIEINVNQEIFTAQIRALYEHTPMVLAVNVINSGLVALVFASYMEQTRWWMFFGLVVTLTVARAIGWNLYRRHRTSSDLTIKWAIVATAGSGLSGLLWGAGSTLLLPDNIIEQTFLAFVIGGMCAGALISLSYYLPAFIAYAYSSVLPLAGSFLAHGGTVYVAMGCMTVVFAAALTFAAHHFNRAFISGLRLNLDLSERTEELTQRTEELIAVNARLETAIAQREVAENQLYQAQKMEALGQLTGGIAHDFNNLLTAVIGNLELAQRRTGVDMHTTRLLEASLSAAARGATLIQDLLTFARRKPLHPKTTDVSAVVDEAEKILKQTIGPSIHLVIRTAPDLRPAWVDPNQLGLAILNLALNARDAMPGGGRLQIACENRRTDAGKSPADLAIGDYVIVSVSDTGTGMSEATLAHAFEPFFTTKEVGRGSGLGLSMVQGFAAQSGGAVQIASSLGEGTTVELWLPQAEGELTVSDSAVPRASALEQRRARILVCDDDGDVRSLVSTFLRDVGYTVWEANNPALALQILHRERPIDLLVIDYAMPEMNGSAVIDRARADQPGLKTLLITGYAEALRNNGVSGTSVLPKPFRIAELSTRIAEILDELSPGDRAEELWPEVGDGLSG